MAIAAKVSAARRADLIELGAKMQQFMQLLPSYRLAKNAETAQAQFISGDKIASGTKGSSYS